LAQTVRPALENDALVLCDRYADSSLAYQGEARGLPWKKVQQANALATQGLSPDLTVFLDIDPEFALRRAKDPNRFELEGVDFQKKVRKGFLRAMKEKPKRWFRLRVKDQTPAQLTTAVLRELQRRFPAAFRKASRREDSPHV
jgi:dTMP kinase